MKTIKNKFKNGSVLVFTLIIMSLMLMMAVSIASVTVIERKMSGATGKSNQAFQVADSGVEKIIKKKKNDPNVKISTLGSSCDGGTVNMDSVVGGNVTATFYKNDEEDLMACDELLANVFKVKSVGIFSATVRAVEVEIASQGGNDEFTKLLLHMNVTDGFNDSSILPKKVTANGNAQISTELSKFGGASGLFDGDGAYLTVPDSDDWNFGNEDFTVDWWEFRTSNTDAKSSIARDSATAYAPFIFGYNSGRTLYVYMTSDGTTWDIASAKSLGEVSLDEWVHLAVVRNGKNFYAFKNGKQIGKMWESSASILSNSSSLSIGRYANINDFGGYIDELRISSIARWKSDFTPPGRQYN